MNKKKTIYINTCLYGVAHRMDEMKYFAEKYGDEVGFEILGMFRDLGFEDELAAVLPELSGTLFSWHGEVLGVEHSAPAGTMEYEQSMALTAKVFEYSRQTRSRHFTMHLNNGPVYPETKEKMLAAALVNYEELKRLFDSIGCPVYVENTGTAVQNNVLLSQEEFTELCIARDFEVLIDVGHAHANSWDIPRLIDDLSDRIRAYHLHNNDGIHDQHRRLFDGSLDMATVLNCIEKKTPDADCIIEYISPNLIGSVEEDFKTLQRWL